MKALKKNQHGETGYYVNSRTYSCVKKLYAEASSGQNNPFYRKKHSKETIDKIQNSRRSWRGHDELTKQIISRSSKHSWETSDPKRREELVKRMRNRVRLPEELKKLSESLKGRSLSKETKEKIAVARKGKPGTKWTEERKKDQSVKFSGVARPWMVKTNTNPEKIAKTAAAHRGMKRTEETRKAISLSKLGKPPSNLGKKTYYDPCDPTKVLTLPADIIPPNGWVRGDPRMKRKKNDLSI